jgi:phasin family protein
MSIDSTVTGPGAAMAQVMTQAKTAAEDFTRMFSEMKLPAMPDMEALLTAQRRNMEAMSAANRIALEGAQAVAKRHMEIMQQTMAEMTETLRSLASTEGAQAKAAKQAELLKRAYERTVSNTKELSDLITRSNGEAIGTLNKRFAEAMDEVKQLMHQAATVKEG